MNSNNTRRTLAVAATGLALAQSASAALVSLTATGTSSSDPTLVGAVTEFREILSQGGGNNGAGGGPFTNGRREINWDAPGLDAFQTPGVMPGNFFNQNSPRGASFQAENGGSLIVSGRVASGSADLRFNSLISTYETVFQSFSNDRLFGILDSNSLTTSFFVPGENTTAATVFGFGAIFTDVDLAGSMIEAFDTSGGFLGSVDVPVSNNGLSFAGLFFNGGERIGGIRITAGSEGLGAFDIPVEGRDMVAMDDFFYSEPIAVPEPGVTLLGLLAGLGLISRRRR